MDLFEKFLEEKKYLTGVTPKTVKTYQSANVAYERIVGSKTGKSLVTRGVDRGRLTGLPTKQSLKDFIIGLQKSSVTVCTINCYPLLPRYSCLRLGNYSKRQLLAVVRDRESNAFASRVDVNKNTIPCA
jgi:hypothetical protein